MRWHLLVAVLISLAGCSKKSERPAGSGSGSGSGSASGSASESASGSAIANAPDAAPDAQAAVAFSLGKPCVRYEDFAKSYSDDDEISVDINTDHDIDFDGQPDAIVTVQWKADIRNYLFAHFEKNCGVPMGAVVGQVSELQRGPRPKLVTVEPGAGTYELVAGRYAKDASSIPLAVDALRWLAYGVADPDLKAISKDINRSALAAAGSAFGMVSDYPTTSMKDAAGELRAVKLAAKGGKQGAAEIAALEAALREVADALDKAAPLVESKPAEAWALVEPPSIKAYEAARELFDQLATAYE